MALAVDEWGLPRLGVPMGDWVERALCRQMVRAGEAHPDDWFPSKQTGRTPEVRAAIAACGRCPVAADCLRWAINHGEQGIWGGKWGRDIRDLHFQTSRQCRWCLEFFAPDEQRRQAYCSDVCIRDAELDRAKKKREYKRRQRNYGD